VNFIIEILAAPKSVGVVVNLESAVKLECGSSVINEFLEVFRLPLGEAVDMVMRGEIPDGKTQCAILRAAAWLAGGK